MAGHIKLGLVGALRDYALEPSGEGIAWERGPANPFAAVVNSSNPYDKVDIWNEWVQEDWQAGVGRINPEEGGFNYAEAETRVPNQVILPPLVQQRDRRVTDGTKSDCRYMPDNVAGSITVGTGGHAKAAMSFTTPASDFPGYTVGYYFYARIPFGVSVTISVYSNNSGSPNASILTSTVTGDDTSKNFNWYGVLLPDAGNAISQSTQYWLVIEPTSASNSLEVAYGSSGYDTLAQGYNGSVWANITSTYLLYTSSMFRMFTASTGERSFVRFNGVLYANSSENLYKYDTTDEGFDSVGTITGDGLVTSMVVFGDKLYIGRSTGNYTTMSTGESFTAAATTRKLFLAFKGVLYSTWQNDLYFLQSDGSTWSSAFPIGGDDVEIRGLAGMGDSVYCATDKALYRFAPGNVVEEATRFGSEDSTNGVGMVEYQGRLYIPAGGRIFRFDPSGQMQDIWISRENDLPASRLGRVMSLSRMNNWLVAYAMPATSQSRPTLWLWQEEGWHFIAAAPWTTENTSLQYSSYYDRATSRLWFSAAGVGPLCVDIDDYTLNPYTSSSSLYMPYGWLEQDRFYGGQRLIDKSWESVTISGDNLSSGVHVKVYWQDEGSTAWELLGTADSDGEELRWSDYSTRPDGKWIKLGLLLQSNDGDETPRVRAVIVKFLPYPNDRIRDSVTLTVKDSVAMPDGTIDAYTLAQVKTHLESLIDSVDPIIYQDPFGTQYEVTITQWAMTATRYEMKSSAGRVAEMRVQLVLEQIPENAYTP